MKRAANDASLRRTPPQWHMKHLYYFCILALFLGCGGSGTSTDNMTLSTDIDTKYLAVGDGTQDLEVKTETHVEPGKTYRYKNVNIYNGGKLIFDDSPTKLETHFWAKSILVENQGSLIAGSENNPFHSILVIHLYGSNEDKEGITCKTTDKVKWASYCGVDADKWADHQGFYHYEKLPDEDLANPKEAFFGRKVLAVSNGGTLQLFGEKGAIKGSIADPNLVSGKSWARLDATAADSRSITLDRIVDWETGDQIVITTTDFLPGHSEQRQITSISTSGGKSVIGLNGSLSYPHNSKAYDLSRYKLSAQGITKKSIETRAAVALLTRHIRIVSAGKTVQDEELPAANSDDSNRYFGGHTIIRQGFTKVQIQGVEFKQLGQGGMLARSPLQFLGVFDPPDDTFVRDCSIHDSMTRWIELRGAQNLLIERNVGYKSIGHGYMSAGHEANNTYRANIGIYARPAIKYPDNPRRVPGVYAATPDSRNSRDGIDVKDMATQSDYVTPAVFLIANPYNTYEHNMAVGAGACGSCYWIVPGPAAGPPEAAPQGYASAMQAGSHAPLKSFKGNFCSTAQYSLLTIGGVTTCNGVTTFSEYEGKDIWDNPQPLPLLVPVKNDNKHALNINKSSNYVPKLTTGNCMKGDTAGCSVTVIDSYTSSFHWGQQNWSAIWLRNNWFLFTDGALTDILGPGLTMVSGGSYEQVFNGYWALTRKTVFVGQTQEGNDFATAAGPKLNAVTRLRCEGNSGTFCLFAKEGITIPTDNFLNYQRFFNIYDGPVYQDSNAYLNIKAMKVDTVNGEYIYGLKSNDPDGYNANRGMGIPKAKESAADLRYGKGNCILTNAAVAWKQPNGFYYPAAFHSRTLFFQDVDLRHFVLIPLFKEGETTTEDTRVADQYCTFAKNDFFQDFTDVDRQTELNDDDGSLSGIKGIGDYGSISLNDDTFYYLPRITYECASEKSCLQAPYDHVTANVFPKCLAKGGDTDGKGCTWRPSCGDAGCKDGIPLYRQYLNANEPPPGDNKQMIRMLGQGIGQRVNLIANNGKYYLDTANASQTQNKFEQGNTYFVYLLYAKTDSKVAFQVYVGKDADKTNVLNSVKMVRVGTQKPDGVVLVDPFEFKVQSPWLWELPDYAPDSGILTVTIDMSKFVSDFSEGEKEACKPSSLCEWKGSYCGCSAKAAAIGYQCEEDVCRWSTRAMECPANGCIGFQFTLPSTFTADGKNHRPAAEPFPTSWNWEWNGFLVDESTAGACHYSGNPPDPR